jgi:putative ABC transport system permease protein
MVTGNFKLAYDSIKSSKWRSFLTMLGIIIGVASVITVVSIGEGVKKQITDQINKFGPDLITVRPGKPVNRDASGQITGVEFMPGLSSSPLTEADLKVIDDTEHVKIAVPLSYVTATPKFKDRYMDSAKVFGTTGDLPTAINQNIEYGEFFSNSNTRNVAVIGHKVAEQLFNELIPTGQSFEIRGQTFNVVGVFEEFEPVTLSPGIDYGSAIFIPLQASKKLVNSQTNIQQILVKPDKPDQVGVVYKNLNTRLINAHAGQDDFTILRQEDTQVIANTVLTLLTSLITAIAAISLIVGGIGIMNIMIVSVTERTQEIGIRKAVGATNKQILTQFITESALISVVGGLLGVIVALLINFMLRISTELAPLITLPIMIAAVGVAFIVGVIFGVAPALNAARKDPIDALRRI